MPAELEEKARRDLVGHYAHITALDECTASIEAALRETGLADNTIFVFTSDHGDSMESNCSPEFPGVNKQRPYDESILVPFFLRWPEGIGSEGREIATPFATPDILPTLLGLSGIDAPATVEGIDFSPALLRGENVKQAASVIAAYAPFADWRKERGGREFRGIRTERYTYARDTSGPWLMFDNVGDPYQLDNLVNRPEYESLRIELQTELDKMLKAQGDEFLSAVELRGKWGYEVDGVDAIPYGD